MLAYAYAAGMVIGHASIGAAPEVQSAECEVQSKTGGNLRHEPRRDPKEQAVMRVKLHIFVAGLAAIALAGPVAAQTTPQKAPGGTTKAAKTNATLMTESNGMRSVQSVNVNPARPVIQKG